MLYPEHLQLIDLRKLKEKINKLENYFVGLLVSRNLKIRKLLKEEIIKLLKEEIIKLLKEEIIKLLKEEIIKLGNRFVAVSRQLKGTDHLTCFVQK